MTGVQAPDLAGAGTRIMGVVNVTPDSFSDGGQWFEPAAAIEHGLALAHQGAHIVDVGGESTRPGAARPPVEEELRRVVPVVGELAAAGVPTSVDTMRAEVAEAALARGAVMVNDVSGGLADPAMVPLVASAAVPFVAMHWRGHSLSMQSRAEYGDVVVDVCQELLARRDALVAGGIPADRIVLDPGLGFAKTAEHNWRLLAALPRVKTLGCPVLVGASRKVFLGRVGLPEGEVRAPRDRDHHTAATSVVCALAGVWAVRVHDVPTTRAALEVAAAVTAHGAREDA